MEARFQARDRECSRPSRCVRRPARSAASIALVSISTCWRVGDDTRNRCVAPAHAALDRRRIRQVADDDVVALDRAGAAHERPHRDAVRREPVGHEAPELSGRADHEHLHNRGRGDRCRTCANRAGAGTRRRADERTGARVRAAHPRARGLAREPFRSHHGRHRRRRHVVQPVGNLVGRGVRLRHRAPRRERQDRQGPVGRDSRGVLAHRASPRTRRCARSSCTITRTTPRCSR